MIAALDRMAGASDRGLELALVVRGCYLEGLSVDAVAGRIGRSPSLVDELRREAIEELFKLMTQLPGVTSAHEPPRPQDSARRRLRAEALALREQALERFFRLSMGEWKNRRVGPHPPPQTLGAHRRKELGAAAAADVRQHMLRCDECLAASRGSVSVREAQEVTGRLED